MSKALFSNNAETVLSSAISTASTTLTVAVGDGVKFPSPAAGEHVVLTVTDGITHEIVHVTSRLGDVLTITRGQEATAVAAWAVGSIVSLRLTAKLFQDIHLLPGAGIGSVAIGAGAASGADSMALGGIAAGTKAVAVGNGSNSAGANSLAVGFGSNSSGYKAVSLGSSNAAAAKAIAIGVASSCASAGGVAIGEGCYTGSGANCIAMGSFAKQKGLGLNNGINIGYKSYGYGSYSTAIGWNARAAGFSSLAVGAGSFSSGLRSVSFGDGAQSTAADSIAIGRGSISSNNYGIAICRNANSGGNGAVAIGDGAQSSRASCIAIGSSANASGGRSISLGKSSISSANHAVGIGYYGQASGSYSVALGGYCYSQGYKTINIGAYSTSAGANAVHIGSDGGNAGAGTVSVGDSSQANGAGSIAIGAGVVNITPKSTMIAGAIMVQKSKVSASPETDFVGAEVVYTTQSMSLAALSSSTITMPIGAVFIPTSCGIIVDASTGIITSQPTILASISQDGLVFTPITSTTLTTALIAKRKFQDIPIINTGNAATHLKADVSIAGASSLLYTGRVYFKGILIQE